ncbi:hypothetical protein FS837_010119 [Tulasnella sp. UAMH 9824]|nr:hypothetical protein FS837_010119 [Tulasnella sp. UAMH 9824]
MADDAAEQMHPSDHNVVAIVNPGEQNVAQAQLQKKELGKREKDLEKSIEKGRADQWAEVAKTVTDHTPWFLCPVQYGVHHRDCTAISEIGVKGNFAAGECVKGNGKHGLCVAQIYRARGGPVDSVGYAISTGNPNFIKQLPHAVANNELYAFGSFMQ